jgi:hypothetical protein
MENIRCLTPVRTKVEGELSIMCRKCYVVMRYQRALEAKWVCGEEPFHYICNECAKENE